MNPQSFLYDSLKTHHKLSSVPKFPHLHTLFLQKQTVIFGKMVILDIVSKYFKLLTLTFRHFKGIIILNNI